MLECRSRLTFSGPQLRIRFGRGSDNLGTDRARNLPEGQPEKPGKKVSYLENSGLGRYHILADTTGPIDIVSAVSAQTIILKKQFNPIRVL